MTDLLSVDTIFFTILGYPLSYVEFVGTILYVWSVWLIAKRNVLTWPVSARNASRAGDRTSETLKAG